MAPVVVMVMMLSLLSRAAMSTPTVSTATYTWDGDASPPASDNSDITLRQGPIEVKCADPFEFSGSYFCSVQPGLTCISKNSVVFYKHIVDNPSFRDGKFIGPRDSGWFKFTVSTFTPRGRKSSFAFMVNNQPVPDGLCESPAGTIGFTCSFSTWLQPEYSLSVDNNQDGCSLYMTLSGGSIPVPPPPAPGSRALPPPLPAPNNVPASDLVPTEDVNCAEPNGNHYSEYFCAFQPGLTCGYVNPVTFPSHLVGDGLRGGKFTVGYFEWYTFTVNCLTPSTRHSAFRFMVNNNPGYLCHSDRSPHHPVPYTCTFTTWLQGGDTVWVANDMDGCSQDMTFSGGVKTHWVFTD